MVIYFRTRNNEFRAAVFRKGVWAIYENDPSSWNCRKVEEVK
jgi:hypothetical protein